MTGRRAFLSTVWAAGAVGIPGRPFRSAVTVTASGTVFHGHPEGRTTLVRFVAEGTDQPAGRLRVFDRAGRLLGTAGMLGRGGGSLAGELWVPLDGEARMRSELEMPGTRRPIVTWHTVTPGPRWIIEWHTLADPTDLGARLDTLAPVPRAVAVEALLQAAVRINPLPAAVDPLLLDHAGLLRLTVPSARAAARYAMPLATIARARDAAGIPNVHVALQGVGVAGLLDLDATPDALGFRLGRREMARRIEGWLDARTAAPMGDADHRAVVIGSALEGIERVAATVAEWNAAWAYPRIVVGGILPDGTSPRSEPSRPRPAADEPDTDVLEALRDDRRALRARRGERAFTTLARLLNRDAEGTAGIAARARLPLAGLLVFNAAPFTRSGIVTAPDSRDQFVTSVPGMGYAWVPDEDAAARAPAPAVAGHAVSTERWTVELAAGDGAIVSLRDPLGREWAGTGGLNRIPGARLDEATVRTVPGGRRLTARRITFRGAVFTEITAYDNLPWVEIVNDSRAVGTEPMEYVFAAGLEVQQVRWEVPGGTRSAGPGAPLRDLHRWLALDGRAGSLMVSAADTPFARVDADGSLRVRAPHGRCRFVLATADPPSETAPWRLAAESQPLIGLSVSGGGAVSLPTFGRLVAVDEPGIHVAAIKPADDGLGAIVYIQETLGIPRRAILSGELLRFDAAFRCDFAERDLQSLDLEGESLVAVPVERHGFSAVRLLGLSIGR